MRPFLHWQCQLGTIPYTVITVKYGVTIMVAPVIKSPPCQPISLA